MHNFPEENQKFQSFNSRIRNASSNEDIRSIMEDMSPKHIQNRLGTLAKKRGKKRSVKSNGYRENYYTFSSDNFDVVFSPSETTFIREGFGLIFHVEEGDIREFKPLPVWRSLNLIEEIIQTGDISI